MVAPPVKAPAPVSKRDAEPERIKPDLSFRIKDSFKQIGQTETVWKVQGEAEKNIHVEGDEPFDERQVTAAFEAYIAKHKTESAITVALTAHKPEIQGNSVVVEVDNQLQIDKLELIKISLQNVLMRALNNGRITLEFKIFDNSDGKEKEKLFTAAQKFDHFMKLNPVVAELKSIFGLELE